MNAIAFTLVLFLVRAIIPFGILILLGEWIRRREANYWFRS
jgi:hypothetical protein